VSSMPVTELHGAINFSPNSRGLRRYCSSDFLRMIDAGPPSRSHRPLVAVAALIALFIGAALVALRFSMPNSGGVPGRFLAMLAHLPTLSATTRFSIDSVQVGSATYLVTGVQPRILVPAGVSITVSGWAVDDKAAAPGKAVYVYVDGHLPAVMAEYGIGRNDVARTLRGAQFAASGFAARVETSGLLPGQHELTFAIVNSPGTGLYHVPARIQFTIRDGARENEN
jgi:hypothetical protein